MYNILILSAGRRVELIQCFHDAAKRMGIKNRIIAADLSNTAPALYFADGHYQIPRIGSEHYIESIESICVKEKIALIVPTIDTELLLLSQHKEEIEEKTGARVLVSDYDVIQTCRNKKNTQSFFEKNGFGVPKEYTENDIKNGCVTFPVFIKPLDGSSSVNAFVVKNQKELNFFYEYIENPIVQDLMEGEEYTVDIFTDFESRIISIVPRIRLAVRSGEIAKGRIVKDREIIEDVRRLIQVLKPIGHITVQCMNTQKGIQYIEINPRFGGGAPMSIRAGADSCENLYRLLAGEQLSYSEDYREGLLFLRFDSSIALDEKMEKVDDKSSHL